MPRPTVAEVVQLELGYRKARRVVIGHFVFFIVCCIVAFVARSYMKFPLQLAWVFIVFALVFAGDLARFFYRRKKLQRLLRS